MSSPFDSKDPPTNLPQIHKIATHGLEALSHYYIPATQNTVQWGYFSKLQKPILQIQSGDSVTMEVVTQQSVDAYDSMIMGDQGVESIFYWVKGHKTISERGPGPHICTGPIYIKEAQVGDILEVRILDMKPRPCKGAMFNGRHLGVNIAAKWGFQSGRRLDGIDRDVVTVYEIFSEPHKYFAKALYSYQWGPNYTDPDGMVHQAWNYPGLLVGPQNNPVKTNVLQGIEIPLRPHFGVMGLAPGGIKKVSTTPPAQFGGNIDDCRIGKGGNMYYRVETEGGLFSVGDAHAAQGDSECCGTAIESSWNGTFQLILHKKQNLQNTLKDLDWPLLETETEWVVHGFSFPNYIKTMDHSTYISDLKNRATLDLAFEDAFVKTRNFLMRTQKLSEDEVTSLMSIAVDFGITQVVDANIGVHAIIKKSLFLGRDT